MEKRQKLKISCNSKNRKIGVKQRYVINISDNRLKIQYKKLKNLPVHVEIKITKEKRVWSC